MYYRLLYEKNFQEARQGRRRSDGRVLLVGAGEAGIALLRQLRKTVDFNHDILGFVDDQKRKSGMRLHGVQVLGGVDDLPKIVQDHKISGVYIAIPSIRKAGLQRITDKCLEAKILSILECAMVLVVIIRFACFLKMTFRQYI